MSPEASNFPKGLDSFFGGLRRREPTGGSAKGIALKESTFPELEPMIVPEGTATVTLAARSSMAGEAGETGAASGIEAGAGKAAGLAETAVKRPRLRPEMKPENLMMKLESR